MAAHPGLGPTPQQEALAALLERSGRESVPIRRSFVQDRRRGGGPGPLAAFVTGRRRRALDLYLLLHAVTSKSPWDVELPGVVWGRLLGLAPQASGTAVTRQWTWLGEQKLVAEAVSAGRERRLVLLREDGSGRPYEHPGASTAQGAAEGDYFHLPHSYWTAGMQDLADLPTKAVLLIALSLSDGFLLPLDKGPRWYGISKDTVRTGLRGLLSRGFLEVTETSKSAPLSAMGWTIERRYTLRGPFKRAAAVAGDRLPQVEF